VVKPSIYFHAEEIKYILPKKKQIRQWIIEVSTLEGKKPGAINIVLANDSYVYDLNVKHLGHDTYTDIITFDYSEKEIINGDVFISMDRVKENARVLGVSFKDELHRVIIHGILHLLGYKDKSKLQKQDMRAKEDYYLSLLPGIKTKS
jgi:rRNA maturation RNase YbeY